MGEFSAQLLVQVGLLSHVSSLRRELEAIGVLRDELGREYPHTIGTSQIDRERISGMFYGSEQVDRESLDVHDALSFEE